MNTGYANPYTVADAAPSERAAFIRSTYMHLGLAILAFIGVTAFLLGQSWTPALVSKMSGMGWLVVLGAFMAVSWISDRFARSGPGDAVAHRGRHPGRAGSIDRMPLTERRAAQDSDQGKQDCRQQSERENRLHQRKRRAASRGEGNESRDRAHG